MNPHLNLRFHHVGCLVANLEESIRSLRLLLSEEPGEILRVEKQFISVCFLRLADQTYLELICPEPEAAGLRQMLQGGQSFYHIAFLGRNVEDMADQLRDHGYRFVSAFPSPAFGDRTCVFLRSSTKELIELIEEPPA